MPTLHWRERIFDEGTLANYDHDLEQNFRFRGFLSISKSTKADNLLSLIEMTERSNILLTLENFVVP